MSSKQKYEWSNITEKHYNLLKNVKLYLRLIKLHKRLRVMNEWMNEWKKEWMDG